jgi:hypothetical protein
MDNFRKDNRTDEQFFGNIRRRSLLEKAVKEPWVVHRLEADNCLVSILPNGIGEDGNPILDEALVRGDADWREQMLRPLSKTRKIEVMAHTRYNWEKGHRHTTCAIKAHKMGHMQKYDENWLIPTDTGFWELNQDDQIWLAKNVPVTRRPGIFGGKDAYVVTWESGKNYDLMYYEGCGREWLMTNWSPNAQKLIKQIFLDFYTTSPVANEIPLNRINW